MKLTSRTVRTTLRNDDYITRDHRVHGVSVLPGVTFIDLVYRMFGVAESIGRLELRNLVFTEPVVTSDQFDQQLEITTGQEAAGWMARLRSTRIKDGVLLGDARPDIFRCELHVGPDGAPPARALVPLIESATQVTDIAELYAGARRLGIEHREFMTSGGRIHEGSAFALAEVRLGALAKRLSNQFCIHPVFMDVATGVPQFVRRRSQNAPEKPYIPIFIESVRAWRPLTDPCFIYVDKHGDDSRPADLITADVAIYDAAGNLAVDMRRLTLKRVRAERLIVDLVGASSPQPRPQATITSQASVEAERPLAESAGAAAGALEDRVTAGLQALAVSALQKPIIDPAAGFYEQGFESTDLLGFVRALEDALGMQLYPTLLFEYPTVRELARFLVREHASSLGALAPAPRVEATTAGSSTTRADVVRELRGLIAAVTGRDADTLPVNTSFYDLGLDSAHLTGLVGSLESKLGRRLYPTLLFEYTTIDDLAGHLHTEYAHLFSAASGTQTDRLTPAGRSRSAADARLTVYVPERGPYHAATSGPARPADQPAGALFVFDTDARLADALRGRDAARDRRRVVLVKPAEDFRAVSADLVELRSDRRADYDRLLATEAADATPQTIVYAWTLADAASAADGDAVARLESATSRIDHGVRGILHLLQAAAARGGRTRVNLVVLAPAACGPETRALAALFRTIASEAPGIDCRLVTAAGDRLDADALASMVDHEFASRPAASCEVEHRTGGPVTERLRAAGTAAGDQPTPLRRGGTYVITGGAGGLGRVVADHLVRNYQANVVLIGRSLPLESTDRLLEAWQRLGSRARYVRADVCDYEAMRAAFAAIRGEVGPVHGIVHCAGVIDDALFVNKPQASLSRVLAPKVYGTIVLDYVSRDERLDFFATFSSASAVFGNPGHADYAFANAFMDGYAEERESLRQRGARHGVSVSIAWPLWDAEGMAQTAPQQIVAFSKYGLVPLPPQVGCQAFERVLTAGVQRALVLYGDQRTIEESLERQGRLSQPVQAPMPGAARPVAKSAPLSTAQARAAADGARAETDVIAVVGLAGDYPGCANLDEFWRALADGRDFVTEVPAHRWDYRKYFHPERGRPGCSYSKWGSFLENYDKFDPLFFNLSPRDAEMMDPQERLFLETSWAAIEDAGYTPGTLAPAPGGGGNVGVFAGVMWSDYQLCGFEQGLKGSPGVAGSWFSMIPNRVSYLLNFNGPSLPVDTACSSSLLAVHLACESLKRGECDVALAGGVNLSLHPQKYVTTSQLAMFSSEGRCRSFGEGGDGYVPGEGVGVVVLKPLARALADGDHVYGVIRGTASRHGGRTSGFAVPSPAAQASLIAANLQQSGVDARTITCVEAHGTGTALGDPIEVRGLSDAFGRFTKDQQFCSLGSVKSNLGHLESAAGIVALTKVLLQLQHAQLAPTLHASTPNRHIDFEHSPFVLQQTLGPWQRPVLTIDGREQEVPRRAAISSFGAGGVNAHVIVEEFESGSRRADATGEPLLFVLSARSGERLETYARRLKAHLESMSRDGSAAPPLADVAYTLQVGRVALEERAAFIASTAGELLHKLDAWLHGRGEAGIHTGNVKAAAGVADVLSGGTEARQFVASLIASRQLTSLARLWVNGVPIEWPLLYNGARPRRCALPTYPFARERYWVGTPAGEAARSEQPSVAPIDLNEPADIGVAAPAAALVPVVIDPRPVAAGLASAATPQQVCEDYLKTIIAAELKLSASRIDVTEPVLNYGLDSVVMMKLRSALEDHYGELPVMLLFDYNTIRTLATFLVDSYPEQTAAMIAGLLAETAN